MHSIDLQISQQLRSRVTSGRLKQLKIFKGSPTPGARPLLLGGETGMGHPDPKLVCLIIRNQKIEPKFEARKVANCCQRPGRRKTRRKTRFQRLKFKLTILALIPFLLNMPGHSVVLFPCIWGRVFGDQVRLDNKVTYKIYLKNYML